MKLNRVRLRNLCRAASHHPERVLTVSVVLAAGGSRGEHPLEIVAVVSLCLVTYVILWRLAAGQTAGRN